MGDEGYITRRVWNATRGRWESSNHIGGESRSEPWGKDKWGSPSGKVTVEGAKGKKCPKYPTFGWVGEGESFQFTDSDGVAYSEVYIKLNQQSRYLTNKPEYNGRNLTHHDFCLKIPSMSVHCRDRNARIKKVNVNIRVTG